MSELESHGLTTLLNGNSRLETERGPLQIVGTDDPFFGLANMEAAYEGVDENEPVLLLAHSPDAVADLNGRRCDVMLSGHTHGGQILAPIGLAPGLTNTELKLPAPYGLMVAGRGADTPERRGRDGEHPVSVQLPAAGDDA